MYLNDATNDDIKTYAAALGYELTDDDADDVRATAGAWYGPETMRAAVNDYLNAFER